MKLGKLAAVGAVAVIVVLGALVFVAPIAQAQAPPPDDPYEPWTPPGGGGDGDGFLAGGGTPPPPGARCTIQSAFMRDQVGNARTEFIGSELIYLDVTVSIVPNTQTVLWVAEYFPTGTLTQHWLFTNWPVASSGTWSFGPFYAQPFEPEGVHTWRIWLVDYTAGYYTEFLVNWNYLAEEEEAEEAAALADISTSTSVSLSSTSIKVNEAVSVFATVNPANSGSVTVEQSKDGMTWFPIGSGTGTGTVISQFTPTEAGTYFVRARCTEYLDSAANKKYLASESSPVTLEVTKAFNWVLYVVVPVVVIAVGVGVFFLLKRGAIKRA